MATGEEPSPVRIGHAERTAAQRALDAHLDAGRLGIDEYADRSAAAAGAVVAADLAALFTDLPEPHPELPAVPAVPPPPVNPANAGAVAKNPPRLMGIAVAVVIGLALLTRQPAVFMLIPLAAVLIWFSRR